MMSLGVVMRRLGVVTGILRTRAESVVRIEHHGGPITELNARMASRTEQVRRRLAGIEDEL